MSNILKRYVSLLCAITLVAGVVGCSKSDTTSGTKEPTTQTETKDGDKGKTADKASDVDLSQKEAPMLAEEVAAGKLPKLEERLPVSSDIMVEPDVQNLGNYGGDLRMTFHDHARWSFGPLTEQSMFRFKSDGSGEVEPNVCKAFSSNEDSTVWTVELREGMKWSDGEPFTADDVMFYYEHMSTPALNDDNTAVAVDDPSFYNAFTSKPYRAYYVEKDGKTHWAKFDKVDDYKFTVTFVAPKPNFPANVAVDNKWMFAPKHIYKNFVARKDGVTDDATFPLITEEEAMKNASEFLGKEWNSYSKMGKSIGYYSWDYHKIPSLRSFVSVKDNWNKVGEVYTLVRNPYFFKTDAEGRQLPYIDNIKITIINEPEQVNLKAVSGELDLLEIVPADFAIIASSTKATHRVSSWSDVNWGHLGFGLNQTVEDPDKRILFQDKRFREALSISVDRNLINATMANSQLAPAQLSVPKGLVGYDAEWSKKWTEYDVEKANKILDELTEPWDRTPGTFRKMKGTNKDLEIIKLIDPNKAEEAEIFPILQSAYREIGVKFSDKIEADIAKQILANTHEATSDLPYGSTPALRPDAMVPMRNYMGWYGAFGKWYEDGKSEANGGIAPTGDMLALVEAYDAMRGATGSDRDEVIRENVEKIYDLHKENMWAISFLSPPPSRHLVSNKLMNFPDGLVKADEFRYLSMARPEQFYFAK